jgi:hypothetical protein
MPALLIAAALAATTPAPPDPCANALITQTVAPAGSPPARKLGDLPPAHLMHAVLRRVDGCEVAEVRQANGLWTNVPTGPAFRAVEPARKAAPSAPIPGSP